MGCFPDAIRGIVPRNIGYVLYRFLPAPLYLPLTQVRPFLGPYRLTNDGSRYKRMEFAPILCCDNLRIRHINVCAH